MTVNPSEYQAYPNRSRGRQLMSAMIEPFLDFYNDNQGYSLRFSQNRYS